jgi:hypothetical protein
VRYELPLEETLLLLRTFGWHSAEELVVMTADDVVHVLGRFLAGELSASQIQHWAELLELREDVGFEPRWAEHLRLAVRNLATPEVFGAITPDLARRIIDTFAGGVA